MRGTQSTTEPAWVGVREGPCVEHTRRQNDFPPAGTAPASSTKSSCLLWLILALSLFFPRVNFGKTSRLSYTNPVQRVHLLLFSHEEPLARTTSA